MPSTRSGVEFGFPIRICANEDWGMRQAVRPRAEQHSSLPSAFTANRAVGAVEVGVRNVDGVTRRSTVHEAGSLRIRFPSPETDALSAVLINTAGGVAGGDRFSVAVRAEPDAKLTITTAAAEKVYRSHGPDSEIAVDLKLDAGARLAWLPQETILFDRAALSRRIDIDVAATASLLCAESSCSAAPRWTNGSNKAAMSIAGACAAMASWCLRKRSGSMVTSASEWHAVSLPMAALRSRPC